MFGQCERHKYACAGGHMLRYSAKPGMGKKLSRGTYAFNILCRVFQAHVPFLVDWSFLLLPSPL